MMGVRGSLGVWCPVNLPSLPITSNSHVCQLHLCLQTPSLGLLLFGALPQGCALPSPAWPVTVWLWGSIPATLLVAGLSPLYLSPHPSRVPRAGHATVGGGCLMEQHGMRSCCLGPSQLPGDRNMPCGDQCCSWMLA